MNQDNVGKVVSTLNTYFYGKRPTIEMINGMSSKLELFLAEIPQEEIDEGIRQYKVISGVSMDPGEILTKHQDDKWFEKLSSNKDNFPYFYEYLDYLNNGRHMSQAVIESTKQNNFLTMRNFADPTSTDIVQRKGLVVGDVQAGKTLNYIGLMNLAADVGYKNIILLTGTTEELRKQTQRRVDEGFVGAYSESLRTDTFQYCGISNNHKDYRAITLTSWDSDFSAKISQSLAMKLSDIAPNLPKVFVIKKNVRILKQVHGMVNKDAKFLNKDSVLIIDDECDYASLNTKSDEDPTAVNSAIRNLMHLYSKSTYVGYSATPFANIFVNPDAQYSEDGSEKKVPDLFPSDFIVLLESPSNYIGAKDMFSGFDEKTDSDGETKQVGTFSPFVHLIGDHINSDGEQVIDRNFLPAKHKKDDPYLGLADSLKKAIKVFLLSSCVFSLRGYEKEHRTMLINISRFNDIQENITHYVKEYLKDLKNAIDGSVKMSDEYFNNQEILSDLEPIWENDIAFSRGSITREKAPNKEYTFKQIKSVMKQEIDLMETFTENTRHKKDRLDYKNYEGIGVRGIVVGGFTLSRGLTLIGLMTSYYNRNAMAYDTLIQMGRWFGYRDGYDDLINVYMTQSSIDAFCAASDATEDLKVQFRHMAEEHKKPIDFGLMVREAPSTLENIPLVTAQNKMRNAKELVRSISLTGAVIDTSKIFKSRVLNERNGEEIKKFLNKISTSHLAYSEKNRPYYDSVSKDQICEFLEALHVSEANRTFDCHILSKFILGNSELNIWNVVVAFGHGRNASGETWNEPINNGLPSPMDGSCVKRSFSYTKSVFEQEDFFRVGGSKNTIVDTSIFTIALTSAQIESAKAQYLKDKPNSKGDPGSRYWLMESAKPYLIIYPIDLKPTSKSDNDKSEKVKEYFDPDKDRILKNLLNGEIVYGLALGFPGKVKQILEVKYRINMVKQRELEENDLDEDVEAETRADSLVTE